jgi:predicted dehydrogenase
MAGIGMGGQGSGDLGQFMGDPRIQVVAVCDVKNQNLERITNTVNNRYKNTDCKGYVDDREVIARSDIDMILCATTDHWHLSYFGLCVGLYRGVGYSLTRHCSMGLGHGSFRARQLSGHWAFPGCDHGTTFFGEKGWVSVDRGSLRTSNKEWQKLQWGEKDIKLYASKGHQWDNFIQCVKTREPTVNPIESAVNGDLICHLSDFAVRTGREIKWDPKAEKIIADKEAELFLDRTLRAPWKVERA